MKREEWEKLISENTLVIVDFYAEWCQPCKMLRPTLTSLCERNDVKFVALNIEDADVVPLASAFDIKSIPFVVRVENGKVTDKMVGLMGEVYIEKFIKGELDETK